MCQLASYYSNWSLQFQKQISKFTNTLALMIRPRIPVEYLFFLVHKFLFIDDEIKKNRR
jgi:hypothetical protein